MAKTGGVVAKLHEKEKRRVMKARYGDMLPMLNRSGGSYHDAKRQYDAMRLTLTSQFKLGLEDGDIPDKKPPAGPKPPRKLYDGEKVSNPEGYMVKPNRSERRARERQLSGVFEV